MFGSEILEVAIGLVLLYSLLAVLATTIREIIEAVFRSRGRNLERAIQEMLGSNAKVEDLYRHPMIHGLFKGAYELPRRARRGQEAASRTAVATFAARPFKALGRRRRLPSYIPSRHFALALFDMTVGGDQETKARAHFSLTEARRAITVDDSVSTAVRTAINAAQHDPDRAIAELEAWYNGAMDRASGWYKRQTLWIILAIAFAITAFLNANSITIVKHLSSTPGIRSALVARAEAVSNSTDPVASQTFSQVRAQLDSLRLPLGQSEDVPLKEWPNHVRRNLLGWLITALAISLGAPFWFDLLNKMMVIRSTVKPREKSQEEGSEDRRSTSGRLATPAAWTPLPAAPGSVPANAGRQLPAGPGAEGKLESG